jgi:predicted nucleic acid-binding protein
VVLVDASIWIRFLAAREPFATSLDELLGTDQVLGHDLVHGELLIGDSGGRRSLLEAYARIHRAATVPHAEVVEFVKVRKLRGRGIGWVDAHLLASALTERCSLWTADSNLAILAAELRVAHSRPAM